MTTEHKPGDKISVKPAATDGPFTERSRTMNEEDREGMITTLSVMTGKPESYFEDMEDVRIVEEYDRLLKIL